MLIDFELPEHLIARQPSDQRDQCRMLVFDRSTGSVRHAFFNQLSTFLDDSYFLVMNQARVSPSRIFWNDPKNKKQEIVFLKNLRGDEKSSTWEAIVSGKNLSPNQPYPIDGSIEFTLLKDRGNSIAYIQINRSKVDVDQWLEQKGQLPLPPYILKKRQEDGIQDYTDLDKDHYQTVFSKRSGAVAAPTAGLHFTNKTFTDLKENGIDYDFIHLSVGWGTFAPLTSQHFETKKLHPEFCSLSGDLAERIQQKKKNGKKILAVGTTSVRTLETWAQRGMSKDGFEGETDIFITPPHTFKVTDALLTNFHMPQSSLLLLVAAFLGKGGEKKVVDLYQEAITKNYRFYSYGDCILIV
jgi:S-adenosylmethionine:tRNA ribosyltransferase-isomerase